MTLLCTKQNQSVIKGKDVPLTIPKHLHLWCVILGHTTALLKEWQRLANSPDPPHHELTEILLN